MQTTNAGESEEKKNPPTLLVGMWIGAATVENSKEGLQKTKNKVLIWSNNPTSDHVSRENHNSKNTCTLIFAAALFTIAKTQKQTKCPLTDGLKKCGTYLQWNTTQP